MVSESAAKRQQGGVRKPLQDKGCSAMGLLLTSKRRVGGSNPSGRAN